MKDSPRRLRFEKVAANRVASILKGLESLEKCSNKNNYEYNSSDIRKMEAMEKRNAAKADALYNEIDRNSLFSGTAVKEDRSLMNVCFLLNDESLQDAFLADAEAAGCMGIKGHRSVGGFRASIYNAMDLEGVNVLVEVMKAFEVKHG